MLDLIVCFVPFQWMLCDPWHKNKPVVACYENWVLIFMIKSYLLALKWCSICENLIQNKNFTQLWCSKFLFIFFFLIIISQMAFDDNRSVSMMGHISIIIMIILKHTKINSLKITTFYNLIAHTLAHWIHNVYTFCVIRQHR